MNEIQMRIMAAEAAERHRTPETNVRHPPGVIVPNDKLLTSNIKDPNYVPYCGPCVPFQRLRRIPEGFICPTCRNKSNWDLTKFDGNQNVQYEEGYTTPVSDIKTWNANVEARRQQRLERRLSK